MFPAPARIVIFGLLVLATTRSARAQAGPEGGARPAGSIRTICAFPAADPSPPRYKDFKVSDLETQIAITRMLKEGGIKTAIPAYVGPVAGVLAVVSDDRRLVVYNPDFLRDLSKKAKNNWVVISRLAHAIGHHAAEEGEAEADVIKDKDRYSSRELRADAFSGTLLRKLGASLDDALAAALAEEASKISYPTREQRVSAISKAYRDQEAVEAKAAPDEPRGESPPSATGTTPSKSAADVGPPPPPPPGPSEPGRAIAGPVKPGAGRDFRRISRELVPCTHLLPCHHFLECRHLIACIHLERKRPIHPSDKLHDFDPEHPHHAAHVADIVVDSPASRSTIGVPFLEAPRSPDSDIFFPPSLFPPDRGGHPRP